MLEEEVLKRLGDLESAKHVVEQQADSLTAQNAALSKEVERLSYQVLFLVRLLILNYCSRRRRWKV